MAIYLKFLNKVLGLGLIDLPYEEVLPLNLLPSMLLRNVVLMDTEKIQDLGGLELDEEDLSLCSFVCPGKYDFGFLLRAGLTKIEIEG